MRKSKFLLGLVVAFSLTGTSVLIPDSASAGPQKFMSHLNAGDARPVGHGYHGTAALGADPITTASVPKDPLKEAYRRPTSIPFPEDNPYSDAKAELGKKLFFDPRLSSSNLISCASCHNPSFGWEDAQSLGSGNKMGKLGRHTPTILNLAWGELFFWDGRAETLEEQALGPIMADAEMAQPMEKLIEELKGIAGYKDAFDKAFPGSGVTPENIGKAIATYERTVVSNLAPFDHWVRGDETAISAEAKRGFEVFNKKGRCAKCHAGWNFTDHSFHDIGIDSDDPGAAEGIGAKALQHAFKTPGLRNIIERAPYMHDGSLMTLREVVDHYNDGFKKRETLSDEMKTLALTEQEKSDLVAFLETLSSRDDPVDVPVLPN